MSRPAVILFAAPMNALAMKDDKDLAIRITKEAGVATIPVSVFYHDEKDDKVLRFCFSKEKRNT